MTLGVAQPRRDAAAHSAQRTAHLTSISRRQVRSNSRFVKNLSSRRAAAPGSLVGVTDFSLTSDGSVQQHPARSARLVHFARVSHCSWRQVTLPLTCTGSAYLSRAALPIRTGVIATKEEKRERCNLDAMLSASPSRRTQFKHCQSNICRKHEKRNAERRSVRKRNASFHNKSGPLMPDCLASFPGECYLLNACDRKVVARQEAGDVRVQPKAR